MAEDPSKATPATPSEAFTRMEERRLLIRDLKGSTFAMRKAATRWLPREPGEVEQQTPLGPIDPYQVRLSRSVMPPQFPDAIKKLAGKVFSQTITPYNGSDAPPKGRRKPATAVPPRILALLDDIDLRGNDLNRFAEPLFRDMWTEGRPFVLVDHSSISAPEVPTLASDASGRPYWIYYPSSACYRAVYHYEGGRLVWDRIQLTEFHNEPAGPWGTNSVERKRVLYRGIAGAQGDEQYARFEFYRQNDKLEWLLSGAPGEEPRYLKPHTEIPGVFFPFGNQVPNCPDETYPELEDLAFLCLQKWQKKSDQDRMIHRIKVALLFMSNMSKEDFEKNTPGTLAAFNIFFNPNSTGDMKVVETTGAGAAVGFKDLELLDAAIRLASLQPEIPNPAPKTLGEKVIDTSESESRLKASADGLEDGLEQLLAITALAMGESQGGSLHVPKEFSLSETDPIELTAILAAFKEGGMSLKELIRQLTKQIKTMEDVDVDAEFQAIQDEKAAAAKRAAATAPPPPSPGDAIPASGTPPPSPSAPLPVV